MMTFPLTERPLPPHPPLVKASPWEHSRPDKKLRPPDFTVQGGGPLTLVLPHLVLELAWDLSQGVQKADKVIPPASSR